MTGDNMPATRGEVKRDLEKLRNEMFIEFAKVRGEMSDMKQELLASSQQQTDRILSRLDFYTARKEN